MRQKTWTLDDLRSEIDEIDDALHDLLIRRAEITKQIAKLKQGSEEGRPGVFAPAIRPAREAAILRRLLARHRGDLPARVIVRIWREIIAASLHAQARFQLHIYGGTNPGAFRELAQSYFGSLTPVRIHPKPSQVVHACAEEPHSLGVVPLPEIEELGAAWWAKLAPAGEKGPRVIAKLPFVVDGGEVPSAYAIGSVEQEASGDDTTLLLLEIAPGLSRTKLQTLLREVGLDAKLIAAARISEKGAPDEVLVELKGFIARDDSRLIRLSEMAEESVVRMAAIGGFANPIKLSASVQ